MNVLGLSFDYHDAAAALVCDGEVVAAAQEERFTRRKHDASLPRRAVAFCLEQAGLDASGLDAVAFYERPLLKFDRIVSAALSGGSDGAGYLDRTLDTWLRQGKFDARERLIEALGIPGERLAWMDHHQAHAASAFFCSPFDTATVVTIDGVGEYETASVSLGSGTRIEPLASLELPHSLGLFYSAFTAFLGFEVNEGEYKVMGMAGFGEPAYEADVRALVDCDADGFFRVHQEYFHFLCPHDRPYSAELVRRFGSPRAPESPFRVPPAGVPASMDTVEGQSRHYANLAASVQRVTEDVILHVVERAVARTGVRNVCLAGGVALNSLANGRLSRELGCRLYVHPAAGDSGGALGAALHYYHGVLGRPRQGALTGAYLGRAYDDAAVEGAIERAYIDDAARIDDRAALIDATVERLAGGRVVGWLQGRFEWGPRALGNRSILASPIDGAMQRVVNEKIKFREPFRPFAPSVLADRAAEFFEIGSIESPADPEHFMLAVCRVRPDRRADIPAVTHVDGTARVQLVRRETNPLYYDLIEAFGRRTGVPVLLNTSFNLRGEPIVASPDDALKTFSWSDMDSLVMGRHVVDKKVLVCE